MTSRWFRIRMKALRGQEVALCFVRKWWRPASCVGLATGTWVNLVYLPLKKGEPVSLAEGAAWITALTAAFAVREWGKRAGTVDSDSQ